MIDRELLEAAAKAAGIKPDFNDGYEGEGDFWNPLTDDGDRYRLAKKLDIRIHFGSAYVTYQAAGKCGVIRWPEDEADDAHAIVRAAAALAEREGE